MSKTIALGLATFLLPLAPQVQRKLHRCLLAGIHFLFKVGGENFQHPGQGHLNDTAAPRGFFRVHWPTPSTVACAAHLLACATGASLSPCATASHGPASACRTICTR